MTLVGFDGTPTGTLDHVAVVDAGRVSADGAGYLLFGGTGGVYDARPSGITRITTGDLLATGPTTWLTDECDAQFRCATTVINRAHRRPAHAQRADRRSSANGGVISPDGTTAAVLEGDDAAAGPAAPDQPGAPAPTGRPTLTLDPNLNYQDGLFVWSPDSHWLFATNGDRPALRDRCARRTRRPSSA